MGSRRCITGHPCTPAEGVRAGGCGRSRRPAPTAQLYSGSRDRSTLPGGNRRAAQNAVPLARLPGERLRPLSVVCSTNEPPALASGLRFIDTPSCPASAEP